MATFLQSFQIGQKLCLRNLEQGQLTFLTPEQPGAEVVEVAAEYLLVDDADAGVRTRIPMHLITGVNTGPVVAIPELTPAAA